MLKTVKKNTDLVSRPLGRLAHTLLAPLTAKLSFGEGIYRKSSCPCGGGCPACQAKSNLNISQPNDPAEIEADAIADKVMRTPVGGSVETLQQSASTIQTKSSGTSGGIPLSGDIGHKIDSSRNGGSALDAGTRRFMESRFNTDFSGVRIHTDDQAARLSNDLNAKAFTVGSEIYFGAGQYRADSQAGRTLLAHELAHTLQQSGSNRYVQRQLDEEESQSEELLSEESPAADFETDTESGDLPSEDSPEALQDGRICCANDEEVPGSGIPHTFDIDSDIMLNAICSPTGCVRVTINSRWASRHSARHFRVRMIVFTGPTGGRTINRRFDVGRETQTFRVGRCNSFKLVIEVISPRTSPRLIGDVFFSNC